MKGSGQVLVKVNLFSSCGHGHLWYDAMTNFFSDSKSPILSFFTKFLCKDIENLEKNEVPIFSSATVYFIHRIK